MKRLSATLDDIEIETLPGSSILLYEARITARRFHTISGAALLLGGRVDGAGLSIHVAEGDIEIVEGAKLSKASTINRSFAATSVSGNVVVDAKARFVAGAAAAFVAAGGDVLFGDNVKIKLRDATSTDILIDALGAVTLPRFGLDLVGNQNGTNSSSEVEILGASISMPGRVKIKTKPGNSPATVEILASSGDVTIEQLVASTTAEIDISGANVSIGTIAAGSKAVIKKFPQEIDIQATEDVAIERLKIRARADVRIEAGGTSLDFKSSDVAGVGGAVPTVDIIGGAGSVCDLTGTTIKNATLVTSCDTVFGP